MHVNREELHAVEVPGTFEADGSFDIALVNHGQSVHVHLHLDDSLSAIASLEASNHFVDGDATRPVTVVVDGEGAATGKLKIVSAYGATTRYVDVTITAPEETDDPVEVDESLAEPQPQSPPAEESSSLDSLSEDTGSPELLVLGLGALALVVAAVAVLVVDTLAIQLGALAVLAGVMAAIYLVVADS